MAFIDARRLDTGHIDADLCIIGAGAAGIALAREFIGTDLRVALVESGDFSYRHRTQFLYLGRNTGKRNFSTVFSRFRVFGGSTTRWGGQCRPLDPIDFEAQAAIPYSGWPFNYSHLEPFYRRAQDVCNLGSYHYDPASWHNGDHLNTFSGSSLTTPIYQFSHPKDFGASYRDELETATNVQVYLNANLTEIALANDSRRVRQLQLTTLNGRQISLQAKVFVLACGGIENARLLLTSNRVAGAGIGNDHDLVGRFFMDHAYLFPGYFNPASTAFNVDDFTIQDYARVGSEQRTHLALALDEDTRRREGLNGAALYFIRRDWYKTTPEYMSRGGLALNHLIDILRHRESPGSELIRDFTDLLTGLDDASKTLGRQLGGLFHRQLVSGIRISLEITPCRDSRVRLNNRKDRLGMPRIDVDWQLNACDHRGYHRLLEVLKQEFSHRGLGEFITHERCDADGWPFAMTGGKHHMGTTRMHTDSRQGVVNPDCRIHDIGNLFIAGSSVFPTCGYANPTLTIVALALRLADHLKTGFNTGAFR